MSKLEFKHKRFLLFEFDQYYPSGGLGDVSQTFDSIPEVIGYLNSENRYCSDYVYLYDRLKGIEIDLESFGF